MASNLRKARKSREKLGTSTGKIYFCRESRKITAPCGQVTSKYSKLAKSFWSVIIIAVLMEFIAAKA
jgi:hypothetical protein